MVGQQKFDGLLVYGIVYMIFIYTPVLLVVLFSFNNGLYVAFYYGGGTVGSFVPGIAYRQWGWGAFLAVLAAVALAGLALAAGCRPVAAGEKNS